MEIDAAFCLGSEKRSKWQILEDLGFISSLSDWLKEMPAKPWMAGQRAVPVQVVD